VRAAALREIVEPRITSEQPHRTALRHSMQHDRTTPAQIAAPIVLADAGMETSLIFDDGLDLPEFAAFVLLEQAEGRDALARYYDRYVAAASRLGVGVILDTPTWRANQDWGARLGYGPTHLERSNVLGVELVLAARRRAAATATTVVISGCVGPRGDGYQPDDLMSAAEAQRYHAPQVRALARSATDHVTALTMTYPAEAIGIALAAREAQLPVVISFTVETDGALPTGDSLGAAIDEVDRATGSYPAYYMVNCAHPTHFAHVLDPGSAWTRRIRGVRANASTLSHAELDEATELDAGDPVELAAHYVALRELLPALKVVGGCCGTNHEHVAALGTALSAGGI